MDNSATKPDTYMSISEKFMQGEIIACNIDAWDDVKEIQEEIARKWVDLIMKEEEK